MATNENMIGKSIICGRVGIGEIIDTVTLHDDGEMFYKVIFPKDKCVNYFPVNNSTNYRILTSEKKMKKAISVFKTKFDPVEYKTTQEKVTSQKEMLKESDVVKLAKSLSILNDEKQLHALISKPFIDTLSTFIDEIAFVLNTKRSEAYSILGIKKQAKDSKE
jgi:RNA polymerase-interacting CarD/CdnL/TRCF family regulator